MSEPFECDECEGCDVQLYRGKFFSQGFFAQAQATDLNFTLYSHASHSSHSSHPVPFTPQIDVFLKEWFGIHGGREVLQPTPKDRVFIEKVEDLASYMEVCRSMGAPAWMSVQPYQERDVVLGLEKLFFDFDCELDLEKASSEAHDFALKLQKYYGIEPLIVFSGRKGYHLYVFLWSTVQFQVHRQEVAKEVYAKLQEKLLKGLNYETLDRQVIGDIKRLSRLPYSVHEKTGRTCQPLSLERNRLWLGPEDLHELRKHGIHQDLLEKVCKEVTAKKNVTQRRGFKSRPAGNNKVRPCIESALSNNDLPHLMRLAISVEYLHAGLSVEETIPLFQGQTDFIPEKTRYMIEHAQKRGYKPRRCNTIRDYGFCLNEKCPIFKRKEGG